MQPDSVARFEVPKWNLKTGKGGRRYNPYVFTEQGVAMLSSILNSDRAIQVNIAMMRAFVQMRELAVTNRAMTRRLDELEKKYDSQFRMVFDAIREMMEPQPKKMRKKLHEGVVVP